MKPGGPQLPAVLVNGETTDCLSSSDRGLLYGDGVFETVAVERGRPRFWQRHMQRLQAGCRRLSIEGLDTALLSEETGLLLAGAQDCVLKVIVTRGRGGRGYAATSDLTASGLRHHSQPMPPILPLSACTALNSSPQRWNMRL